MTTLRTSIFFVGLLILFAQSHAQNYNNIEFIENKGQWDDRIKFRGDIDAGSVFIRQTGFTILQHDTATWDYLQTPHKSLESEAAASRLPRTPKGEIVLKSHSWNVDFVGASPDLKIVPDKMIVTYNNYFLGNDPSKWASECRIYQAMTIEGVYPGIDVRYYTHKGSLKYDIIVKPGADVSKIALRYEGAEKLSVKNRQLVIGTSLGEFREPAPFTYQPDPVAGRREIKAAYAVKDNIVTFSLGNYDRNATLVIDPNLIFCTFSGSIADNWGFTATYGPDGSFFGGGIVFTTGGDFPVSPGAFQTIHAGGVNSGTRPCDIGIIRLTPNGSGRIYATYLGGSGNEQPHSLVADGEGNLIIAGRTNSTGTSVRQFPSTGPVIGSGGDYDIFLTKLNATGTALIGSRLIGGSANDGVNISAERGGVSSLQQNYGDDGRSEVILDAAGNICLASSTQSDNFPVYNGFQTSLGGKQDAVVIKMDPGLAAPTPLFSTYLGGSEDDAAYVLTTAGTGDIFVAGGTRSSNFPGPRAAVGSTHAGDADGFIAQISNSGSLLRRTAFVGTSEVDQIYGIQLDRLGFVYVMGQTRGDMPPINLPPGGFTQNRGRIFITKMRPDLSAIVYRTRFGTGSALPNISPTAFLVDRCENVYVSGWGGISDGSYPSAGTGGLITTADALKKNTDRNDFYFFVLRKNAEGPDPLYATFFGQNGGFTDHVDGGTSRFDRNGVIYQSVCANCGAGNAVFPTTPGSWSPRKPRNICNMAMIKIAFNLAGVGAELRTDIGGVPRDTAGCVPLEVTFTDLVRNATEYIWDFGDGTPPTAALPAATGYTQTHTFTSVGTYRVRLIAIDPSSCNERDTAYVNIKVGDLKANLQVNVEKLLPCESLNYQLSNLSTAPSSRPFSDTSFIWDFGDGSPRVRGGLAPVTHSYANPGTYNAKLILVDTSYCNYPDSIIVPVRVAINVEGDFSAPSIGCAPAEVPFIYTGLGGQTFEWDFGDPASGPANTSSLANPTHAYSAPGTYSVRLIVIDPNTCNGRDTVYSSIQVVEGPVADFSYSPTTPVENAPHVFTNLSSPNATRFVWDFGDGNTRETTSRADLSYQYTSPGTFNVCLIAFNNYGCSDTLCIPVTSLITPKLDVPNAFTPNSGDINSVIGVRGFGITKMRFIIWNRWGQKVFETNNPLAGWDGKVRGVVQPMDVYAYTLDVEFFDGTKASKKGDITLIR